ncbi:MAG: winged helix-turn-helix domain-containing protein [Chloroflexota bacterium]|nr:MAG: hypothetical protein DLM70_17790 [Chloroflexota bacterium]
MTKVDGLALTLHPKEFDLLHYLLRHRGVALRRERLLADVWGHEFVGPRTVDVHVRRLRAKMEQGGVYDVIRTIHGVGYTVGSAAGPQCTTAFGNLAAVGEDKSVALV